MLPMFAPSGGCRPCVSKPFSFEQARPKATNDATDDKTEPERTLPFPLNTPEDASSLERDIISRFLEVELEQVRAYVMSVR